MDIAGNRTLYSIFAAYAAHQPQRQWLVYERADGQVFSWTYAEFLESIHRAANLLNKLGIGTGDAFVLHLPNHPAYPQLILAASHLGVIAVPSNPKSTADELAYIVAHSASEIIFTEAGSLDAVREVAGGLPVRQVLLCQTGADAYKVGTPAYNVGTSNPDDADSQPASNSEHPLYEIQLAAQSPEPPPGEGAPDRTVILMYTSGTTARPKGVMQTNAALVYGAEVFRAGSGIRGKDRHLITLPFFHGGAHCHALWPSLIAGASVAVMPRFSASRFFEQAREYECTLAALFGAPLRMLLNQPERPADNAHSLRNLTFAQNLTAEQYDQWHSRFSCPLQQIWGMTETCGLPIMSPLSGKRNLLAMGRPVLGYEIKLVDDDGQEVAPGQQGQLTVRGTPGRSVMLGYLKNPQATGETLRKMDDGTWLYSGDTAYADEDGFLYFVDRGKDLIKRAGQNVSSVEVEAVIADCPGVLDVCVVSMPDTIRDETVAAVIVAKPEADLTAEIVQAHCAERLSPFKVPGRVEFIDALPRTSVGKIQKQIVREWLKKGQ